MILVSDVRKIFTKGCSFEQFALEFGISADEAKAVKRYVDHDCVSDTSLVAVSYVTLGNGQKLGPGNVVL